MHSASTTSLCRRFVKQYAKLAEQIVAAAGEYAEEVRQGKFPAQDKLVPISTARDKGT